MKACDIPILFHLMKQNNKCTIYQYYIYQISKVFYTYITSTV